MKSSRRQKALNPFSGLLLFVFIFINALSVFAGPGKTTYQAKIVKPDGYPLEVSSVNFKFTILDPAGSCVLYSETYSSVNMSSTGGLISFALGSGVKTYPASATTFEQVFSNITPSLSCDVGGPTNYTPSANDIRKIVMQFHDGSGWQTLPAMSINAVPYAMYANEATKLNGLTSSDFVQLSTVPTCTASEALRYTGAGFNCVAVGNSVTSSTVVTALGYTPADGASVTALSSSLTTTNSNVSSVSSTVTSLQNSVAASFAAITSSQWITSGTSINYSTGNVGIGTTTPVGPLHVVGSGNAIEWVERNDATDLLRPTAVHRRSRSDAVAPAAGFGVQKVVQLEGFTDNSFGTLYWFNAFWENNQTNDTTDRDIGLSFNTLYDNGQNERLRITASGKIGIGTTAPVAALDVSGGVRIGAESTTCAVALAGTLRYSASNVEYCNGTSWQAFGVSGAGLQSFNGSTSGTQTLATGTGGTAPNFNTTNGVHTLNIPLASIGSVTAGLISNADYTTFSNKITSSAASIAQVLGYVPADNAASGTYAQKANNLSDLTNIATARTNLGLGTFATANSIDLGSASATGTLAIARLPSFTGDATIAAASSTIILSNSGVTAGTYTKVTVDSKGRVTSSSSLASSDVTTALGYTPASASASTQWTTSGSDIYYNTGNVGIGIANPAAPLDVKQTAVLGGTAGNNILVMRTQSAGGSGGNNVHHNEWRVRRAAGTDWITHKIHDAISVDASYLTPGTDTRTFWERDPQNDIQSWGTSASTYLTINAGNVGIGTTTPTSKLHVQDGAAVIKGTGSTLTVKKGGGTPNTLSSESVASFDNESGSGVAVNFFTGSAQAANIYMGDTVSPQQGAIKYLVHSAVPSSQYMSFSTSSTERLRINSSGNVGVGITAPTAKLHLEAGTTSVAPLKFVSGTLLTSPQSGTIEYDGSNFYITDSTNTRRAIAANTNPGTYDNVSNINSSSNITLTPTGSVVVSSTTASTNSSTGALVVKGGLGVAGDIYTSGTIVTSSNIQGVSVTATSGMVSPYIAGSVISGGNLTLDSTTHLTKGNILLAPNGGNIGIGTTSPSTALEVNGVVTISGSNDLVMKASAQDAGDLIFRSSSGTQKGRVWSEGGAGLAGLYLSSGDNTPDIHINDNGNVGIGMTNPSSQLHVYKNVAGPLGSALEHVSGTAAQYILGSGGSYIGYLSSQPLYIGTTTGNMAAISAKMTLDASGNVGIGTTAPAALLQLSSSAQLSERIRLSGQEFYQSGNTDSEGLSLLLGVNRAGNRQLWIGDSAKLTQNSSNTILRLSPSSGDISSLATDGVTAKNLLLNTNGGNVGIGTAGPSAKLDINAGGSTGLNISQTGGGLYTSTAGGIPRLYLGGGSGFGINRQAASEDIFIGEPGDTGTFRVRGAGTISLGVGATSTTMIVQGNGGNVGIGTTSPSVNLDVNGTIKVAGRAINYTSACVNSNAFANTTPEGGTNYGMDASAFPGTVWSNLRAGTAKLAIQAWSGAGCGGAYNYMIYPQVMFRDSPMYIYWNLTNLPQQNPMGSFLVIVTY